MISTNEFPQHYALRWPRVQKLHLDRSWSAALTGPEYMAECRKALGYLGSLASNSSLPTLVTSDDSLTTFVNANRTSGTDIVELTPVKRPHKLDIKAETPSPVKALRLTKSMPEGRFDGFSGLSHSSIRTTLSFNRAPSVPRWINGRPAESRGTVVTSTSPSDRVLYIKRRCLRKSLSTSANHDPEVQVL
jgi:hypothetical protein